MVSPQAITTVLYSSHFQRAYKRLPKNIQVLAKKREVIFRTNAFDPRLDTHKLKGKFAKFWSSSITRSYRIVFTFENGDAVVFHDTGDHRVYQ